MLLNQNEIMQTIQMIDQQHLDVRTITMGISLLSCAHSDVKTACDKVYDKITRYAEKLVATGEAIEKEFGIPIVNKRISVTPVALVAAAAETDSYVPFAQALDRAAKTCGVNFIGGFSALVQKGMTDADRVLIRSIPEALATTDIVCASVNVGSTKAGIDMDAVEPEINTERRIALTDARHPLMEKERCVPLQFELGKKKDGDIVRGIVITGPKISSTMLLNIGSVVRMTVGSTK